MIRRVRAACFTALWIAVMVVIFLFSNDNAEASSEKSSAVVAIVETVEEVLDLTPTQEIRDMTELIVRKCAHVFLYTCLGITGTLAVSEYAGEILSNIQRKKSPATRLKTVEYDGTEEKKCAAAANPVKNGMGKIRLVIAFVTYMLCFFYACTDEWHQTFRSGRSGSFRDVMIDSIGMVLGIGLVTLISVLWDRFHKKRFGKSQVL
ncbi:MAG: VanZ family protein [Lachnospiraceae bacterium]|nr:VanZ family protein [Lachnospiraceae bacterium]